jgi:hypothetical protein
MKPRKLIAFPQKEKVILKILILVNLVTIQKYFNEWIIVK